MSRTVARQLGHYTLVEKLGEGGMGEVWRALDTRLDREIALKLLPDATASDPDHLARFEREARALAALSHPNIVTVHAVEQVDGTHFFTMELIDGQPLSERIPPQGLPIAEFFDFALPLVEAVAAAHEHGVLHRDLKPGNVMVTHAGRVKVLDFGLAKLQRRDTTGAAAEPPTVVADDAGRMVGTLGFMPPEQMEGRPADQRCDVFALGVLLYLMATGRLPFAGATAADVIAAVMKDAPASLTDLRPDLPHELGRIVLRCLEKDSRHRFPTALALHRELSGLSQELTAGRGLAARSIAVLPLADLSPAKDQDYFCEGIAEEIINSLTKVRGLRVAPRSAAFRFRGTALGPREIGGELGVDTLLEGSVRKAGDRLRISVELTDVAAGCHLWVERFDRNMIDVFAIQEEIAENVARVLELTLGTGGRRAIQKLRTGRFEAYDAYLRGRRFYAQYSRRGVEFARQMFERAIKIDPGYALGYAGLAECHSYFYMFAGGHDADRLESDRASRRALELDPELAEAHAARGVVLSLAEHHDDAAAAFETAIQLDPDLFEARYFYARDRFATGRLEEALRLYEKAAHVNPQDYQSPLLMAQIYDDLRRPEDARAARLRGVKLVTERLQLEPDDVRALYMGANGRVALGDREGGLDWARRALALEPQEPMILYNVACIYALAGATESALECLERALDCGLRQREWLEHDSNLDAVRGDARFATLMERLP